MSEEDTEIETTKARDEAAPAKMKIKIPSKILVVDDEPDLEHLVRQRMRREIRAGRYTFVFAHNGVQALEMLDKEDDIDMVLSDINMPQMDGLTLLEQIPRVKPDIRSVIVSAYGDMKNIRTAMNRGAFDFITKPVDFDDMKITIERTLHHLELWREALSSRDKLVALQQELDVASAMQSSILPTTFPESPYYQIAGNMRAARNVGGDFYDVREVSEDCVGIAVADVSDKGVPAALFMMSCRTLLRAISDKYPHAPAKVLAEINEQLVKDNESMMFVTFFYAIYNIKTGELCYTNGGHNPPVLVHPDGSSEAFGLQDTGLALGILEGAEFEESSIIVAPGDMVVFYTDGVTEAENVKFDLLGIKRLQEMFQSGPSATAQEATERVFSEVKKFAGESPQSDDITCVTLLRAS